MALETSDGYRPITYKNQLLSLPDAFLGFPTDEPTHR